MSKNELENITEAMRLGIEAFKAEHGKDAGLEEGDIFACEGKNFTMIVSRDDGVLKVQFIDSRPYRLDHTLRVYRKEE